MSTFKKAVDSRRARWALRRDMRAFDGALAQAGTDACRRELQTIWASRR
jgi:hypothetical protein